MKGFIFALVLFFSSIALADTNLCETIPGYCDGNLGIPRIQMPQLDKDSTKELVRFYGLRMSDAQRADVRSVKFTQNEISEERTTRIVSRLLSGEYTNDSTYIVSNDGYLLDGHHRLSALTYICNEGISRSFCKIKVIVTPTDIYKLLSDANDFSVGSHAF